MVKFLASVCLAFAGVGTASSVPTLAATGPTGQEEKNLVVYGTISEIDLANSLVTFTTRTGLTVTIAFSEATEVYRNGFETSIDALQIGDRAKALYTPTGKALVISAIATKVR